jgi:hypothetical protein
MDLILIQDELVLLKKLDPLCKIRDHLRLRSVDFARSVELIYNSFHGRFKLRMHNLMRIVLLLKLLQLRHRAYFLIVQLERWDDMR